MQSTLGSFALCKPRFRFCGPRREDLTGGLGSAVMLLEGNLETLDQAIPVEGLRQVTNRPSLKRLRTNLIIGERREENERYSVTLGKQVGLQLDATHAGHLDICNHTRELIEAVRPQKVFGGRECMYDVPERPHKAVSRGAHGRIIVNDCD
jgi:hypothetical protein